MWAVPWLRQLFTGFSLWGLEFSPTIFHVGFVMDRMQLGQVTLGMLQFSLTSTIIKAGIVGPFEDVVARDSPT